jgi:nickel/cobalt transporter (NicO) family protein
MHWLIELQHWLYGSMAAGIKSAEHVSALPALLASAVLFGALHALMPGHGKSVLVSYHLGRPGRLWDGLLTGIVLALSHVGSACCSSWRALRSSAARLPLAAGLPPLKWQAPS